jgi:UDP-2,4-diacetamido-2,4,6-trideoxy-beta-L-altropyranose hydrolase
MKFIFRVDGNEKLGIGHVIRCLTLADEIKRRRAKSEILFITKDETAKSIIEHGGYNAIKASNNGTEIVTYFADEKTLFITDFLNTDNSYVSTIKKKANCKILCIDNNTKLKKIDADIVINANVFEKKEFRVINGTHCYTGPKYMILRKEIEKLREIKKKVRDEVKSIFVIFGGSDPCNFTVKIAKALEDLKNTIDIYLVPGPAFLHHEILDQFLLETNREFHILYAPENLLEKMKGADMAITAGGITLYEFAALGTPSITIPQVRHQNEIAKIFSKHNACINLGMNPNLDLICEETKMLMKSKLLRTKLSKNAKKGIVNG